MLRLHSLLFYYVRSIYSIWYCARQALGAEEATRPKSSVNQYGIVDLYRNVKCSFDNDSCYYLSMWIVVWTNGVAIFTYTLCRQIRRQPLWMEVLNG